MYIVIFRLQKSQNNAFCSISALQKGTPVNLFLMVDLGIGEMFNFVNVDKIKFIKG
jgi:hypothetical protein